MLLMHVVNLHVLSYIFTVLAVISLTVKKADWCFTSRPQLQNHGLVINHVAFNLVSVSERHDKLNWTKGAIMISVSLKIRSN